MPARGGGRKPIRSCVVQVSMCPTTAVDGSPLAPESIRMMDYLKARAAELSTAAIRERVRAAVNELENALAGTDEPQARLHPIAGKWSVAEAVDHIAQTQARATEELRHLLA